MNLCFLFLISSGTKSQSLMWKTITPLGATDETDGLIIDEHVTVI